MNRLALLAVLLGVSLAGWADTLVMNAPATARVTLRNTSGVIQSCSFSGMDMTGSFNRLGSVVVTGITVRDLNCGAPPVPFPLPTVGSVSFTQPSYNASRSAGKVYIAVKRTGSITGSVSVNWTADGLVTPLSGSLAWSAGDTIPKFIVLNLLSTGQAKLSLPGSTATLFVSP